VRFLAQLMTRQVRQFASTWDADHATARPSAPQPPFVTGLLAVPPEAPAAPPGTRRTRER